jgi:DNA invertase Pin-like site-specific DNA recombinase
MSTAAAGRLIGYAHTRPGENIEDQLTAPRAAGCVHLFSDDQVRRRAPWPQLDAALAELRPGDTLVVCKLIRLGQSVTHLLGTLSDLHRRGIRFRSLHDDLGTTDPTDHEQFGTVLEALIVTRRELASENTRNGQQAARTRGRPPGRPPALSPALALRARELLDQPNNTVESVARLLGVSRATIYSNVIRCVPPESGAGSTS